MSEYAIIFMCVGSNGPNHLSWGKQIKKRDPPYQTIYLITFEGILILLVCDLSFHGSILRSEYGPSYQ